MTLSQREAAKRLGCKEGDFRRALREGKGLESSAYAYLQLLEVLGEKGLQWVETHAEFIFAVVAQELAVQFIKPKAPAKASQPKQGHGRPKALTEEQTKAIVHAFLFEGASKAQLAKEHGVSKATIGRTLQANNVTGEKRY